MHKKNPSSSKKLQTRELPRSEVKVYGIRAVEALFAHRPEAIIRSYFQADQRGAFAEKWGKLAHYLAKQKRAYHAVSAEDLAKVTATEHHEGVCVLAQERPCVELAKIPDLLFKSSLPLLAVSDGVSNPHNLGALYRNAACFGVPALVRLGEPAPLPSAAYRMAEGGVEYVETAFAPDIKILVEILRTANIPVIATSHVGTDTLKSAQKKLESAKAMAVVFGHEADGVSKKLLEAADFRVKLTTHGAMTSLNVAAAAAVFFSHLQDVFET